MKIIDKFLIREFLKYFALSLGFIVIIYLLFDILQRLNYFISLKVKAVDIVIYYLYNLPSYVVLLFPVGVILGAFFTIGRLARQKELLALKSGGVDTYRVYLPLIITGTLLTLSSFLINEFLTTQADLRLREFKRYKIEKRKPETYLSHSRLFYYGKGGYIYFIRRYNGRDSTLRNFSVWKFNKGRRVIKRIDSPFAKWRNGKWEAKDVKVRKFTQKGEEFSFYKTLKLEELREKPEDFSKRVKEIGEMNFIELKRYIKRMHRAAEPALQESVEFNYRFSYPLINLILLIIALPLAGVLRKGGVMLGLGLGLLFSFTYWGVIQVSKAMGVAGVLSPFLSAWIPNMFFFSVGIFLFLKTPR